MDYMNKHHFSVVLHLTEKWMWIQTFHHTSKTSKHLSSFSTLDFHPPTKRGAEILLSNHFFFLARWIHNKDGSKLELLSLVCTEQCIWSILQYQNSITSSSHYVTYCLTLLLLTSLLLLNHFQQLYNFYCKQANLLVSYESKNLIPCSFTCFST